MTKVIITILLTIGCFFVGCAQHKGKQVKAKGEAKNNKLFECRIVEARRTVGKITVDGVMDEPCWQKAELVDDFVVFKKLKKPSTKTEARVLWDDEHLYVMLKAEDMDIFGFMDKRDSVTCRDDVFEVFFKTDATERPYYNFEINCLGTIFDAFNQAYGFAGGIYRWSKWNCKDIKVATKVEGTLNNISDKDRYWTLEIAIPFKSLPSLAGKGVKDGDSWKINFTRYDYSVYIDKGRETITSTPLNGKNFHAQQNKWHTLLFVK